MRLILLFILCLTASAQVASVVSTNALALRTPSAVNPIVLVAPVDGSDWELWRYAPSSTSTDWDNALVTVTATGRWLRTPLTGPILNAIITGGTINVSTVTASTITGGEFLNTTPFTGAEPDNSLVQFGMVKELTPAIAEEIDDLLAADVYGLSRWAYLTTPEEFWVYCPDETTADNGTTIRRPDSIASDATPGRWTKITLSGGGGGGSGTVTSITLTQPAAGLTITGSGVAITSTGTPTFALANDLAALEGLSGTGYPKRTGSDSWSISSTVPWSDLSSTPTTLSGYGISDGITSAAVAAGYQPLDSDLTAIAALTTTSFGRGLLDEADASAARTTLGLAIGSNVQAYDADLTAYAGITPSANVQTLLGAANYSDFRTSLGVAIGSDVQAYDADLTTYAGITPSANVQTLLGAANYAAFKTSLSLNNVENTTLSTWVGSGNITTLGTISSGTVPVARVSGLATVATSGSAADLGSGTLPDARLSPAVVTTTGTQTLTNKRNTQRVAAVSYASSITPDSDAYDVVNVGTLTGTITINAPSGTPTDGQLLTFRFAQNATGYAITWNSAFAFGTDITSALIPVTANAKFEVGVRWNSTDSKWRVVALVRGF